MAGLLFAFTATFACAGAHAEDGAAAGTSGPEIVAARELFRQGTEDVDAGRFTQALEKFRRVAAVKETANVRFNIARCEESMNKTGAALADFETAEREAEADAKGDAIAKLSHDRADALRPRVPRLGVVAPVPMPGGLSVSLDGSKLALTTLGVPLPVDPGLHTVDATATGREKFHTSVTVIESESKTVSLKLAPSAPAAPPPVAADASPNEATVAEPPPPTTGPSSSRRTWGIVTLVGAGALAAGAAVSLVVHNNAASSVTNECPRGVCPAGSQSDVNRLESRYHTTQGLAIGLGAGAIVAAGIGTYLIVSAGASKTAPSAALGPGAPGAPAGFSVVGRF